MPCNEQRRVEMVKGCQKKTIHIKDTGSKFYEEAYFVLRPGVAENSASDGDMISEAIRIAGESIASAAPAKRRGKIGLKGVITFILGFLVGAFFSALACILIII